MSYRPKRVLHVVRGMVRAGVETWLMQTLRNLDPRRVQMDFLVHTDAECAFDAEIRERNCRILRCCEPVYSPRYAARVTELLNVNGAYDAIHSHLHHFSGYLVRLARCVGIPLRIAHSHSDTSRQDLRAGWLRGVYLRLAKRWIRAHATHLVAASRVAGRALFGEGWEADSRRRLLHCGIDLTPFLDASNRWEVRETLGIRPDEMVVGHAGRFATPKNHLFLTEVAAEIARRRPGFKLMLIGGGPTRAAVEERVEALGLAQRTIFTGVRSDVCRLLPAVDVFLFPSLWEGLPMTVLEAQAAGLPCVISDVISDEVDVVPGLTRRVPLAAGAAHWAEEVLSMERDCPRNRESALTFVEKSSFNLASSLNDLYTLYNA
jgi:glycosyltransferase involved in cell wall biosynthesis